MAVLKRYHITSNKRIPAFIFEAEYSGYSIEDLAINEIRIREDFRMPKATKINELFKEKESSFVSVQLADEFLPVLNASDLISEMLSI
ncbi:hypothetical protein NPIL_262221 [Nephila pilipes]|uniref:Uncharacterized protein n=1 Tax=Nephila pilipes TaxID=299642 RepID=A0A8X6QPS4_NEPPI|nr:hypothetical protein NPIL_262221 [Nephila pilipes]